MYGSGVKNSTDLVKDSRTATERAIDVGMALHNLQDKRITTEDIISEALANHTRESEKNTEAMEENN